MILGDAINTNLPPDTLDDLLQRAVARRPEALALIDPPNRETFTDGAPRRLTYAQADRAITAIAARLRDIGLATDAVVAIQLPNIVENVLTTLGVLRAGMIAAPLPLLWRRAECTEALSRVNAQAFVTTSRIGEDMTTDMAMMVAADVFPIRNVCGFGRNLPDGVTSFDGLLGDAAPGWAPPIPREGIPGAHVAVVTFDVTADGLVPVARSHAELITGGIAGLGPDAKLLTTIAPGTFGGLALSLVPWLQNGGTLSLHHGFEAEAFSRQCRDDCCDTVVVPGPLVPQLTEAGLLANPDLKSVVAAWRAPERYAASPAWTHPTATLTDILLFGETALIGLRRAADGLPPALPADIGTARTKTGTLSLRGPMVPRYAFPPRHAALPRLSVNAGGFVDTGYPCRVDAATNAIAITGPPPATISVGAYRFVMSDIQHLVGSVDDGAFIMALPDAVAGQRMAGISSNANVYAALVERGINPLIADAFRRSSTEAAWPLTGR